MNQFFKITLLLSGIVCFLVSCKKDTSQSISTPPGFKDSALNKYFVDIKLGNDNNSGKDILAAWKTIQKAANEATGGSTVYIREGIYYENVVINVTGTQNHPITFTNYLNEVVKIDGSKTNETTLLNITNKSYLAFKGIAFQNITKNNSQGISITATENGKVTGLLFSNISVKSINWNENASKTPSSANNSQPFIVIGKGTELSNSVTDLTIDSCEFYNNITGFSEVVSLDGNISNFIISNNKIHDNTNIGIAAIGNYGTSSNSFFDKARDGLISKNICSKNISLYATSGGIYVDGGKNIKIERNTTFENGYGIEVGNERNGSASEISVVANVIYNNQNAGLAIGGYDDKTSGQVLNCSFYNNTLFQNNSNNDGSGEIYITKASNCSIQNNIVNSNSQNILITMVPILPQSNNVFNYNCYTIPSSISTEAKINWINNMYVGYLNYTTLTMQDKNSVFVNPLYKSIIFPNPQFLLTNTSPCINIGNVEIVKDVKQTDFTGLPLIVSGKVSIGAYRN